MSSDAQTNVQIVASPAVSVEASHRTQCGDADVDEKERRAQFAAGERLIALELRGFSPCPHRRAKELDPGREGASAVPARARSRTTEPYVSQTHRARER